MNVLDGMRPPLSLHDTEEEGGVLLKPGYFFFTFVRNMEAQNGSSDLLKENPMKFPASTSVE